VVLGEDVGCTFAADSIGCVVSVAIDQERIDSALSLKAVEHAIEAFVEHAVGLHLDTHEAKGGSGGATAGGLLLLGLGGGAQRDSRGALQ
jgi:hypothetical protein